MEEVKNLEVNFFFRDDNGTIKIQQGLLNDFLEEQGYQNIEIGENCLLVRNVNNILYRVSQFEIISLLRKILDTPEYREVYDVYAKNPTTYIGWHKLKLLRSSKLIDDKDPKDASIFYFKNCFCRITKEGGEIIPNEDLQEPIWQNRIIKREFYPPDSDDPGQFEIFFQKITGNDPKRFQALQSIIGFLLHRNKERGEQKAIILYDEKMGVNGKANGRTGKTMLAYALKNCREVEIFDGKSMKTDSHFKNQRINLTTDILVYDDLLKNTDFEVFYTMLTSDVEVEKKGKDSFVIDEDKAPKLLITSNHYVRGDGGDSDLGRRFEFEICNYFSKDHKPENEFGNRFFGNAWDQDQWNRFYSFMFECVQVYLINGLIEVPPLNLSISKVLDKTCPEFLEFAEAFFDKDIKLDKRELILGFISFYPEFKDLSSHMFTKWAEQYAESINCTYKDKSSGGKYYCWFYSKESQDE